MPTPNNSNRVNFNNIDPTTEQAERFQVAYEQLAEERAALSEADMERINVDVPNTVNIVFGHLPQIRALADEVKELPSFDVAMFEKLESYTKALAYAQMLYNAASKPIEHVPEMAAVVTGIRDRLVADVSALAMRGLMDGSRLADLKGGPGYKNIAYDVGTLVAMLRSAWPKIAGKTALTEDELKRAQVHTEGLVLAIAAREQQEIDVSAAADQRQRAFTLLAKAYDQVRRAASFLRWGESIDEIAPSFYNGRTSKRRSDEPEVVAPAPTPAAPTTPTNGNGSSTTVSAPSGGNGVGLPGASPYAGG